MTYVLKANKPVGCILKSHLLLELSTNYAESFCVATITFLYSCLSKTSTSRLDNSSLGTAPLTSKSTTGLEGWFALPWTLTSSSSSKSRLDDSSFSRVWLLASSSSSFQSISLDNCNKVHGPPIRRTHIKLAVLDHFAVAPVPGGLEGRETVRATGVLNRNPVEVTTF